MRFNQFTQESAFGVELTAGRFRFRLGFFGSEMPTPAHFTATLRYPRWRPAYKGGWQLRIGAVAIACVYRPTHELRA